MLNIDEEQLKLLFEKRRKLVEKPKYDGISEIISGISIIITLALSDFNNVTFMKPIYFRIAAWGVAFIILIYGAYTLIKCITNTYTLDNLYQEIEDIDPKNEHAFDIIVIRNNGRNGKYLVYKSTRWDCWLFPNYKCLDGNFDVSSEETSLKQKLSWDLNINGAISFSYMGNLLSPKFSFGRFCTLGGCLSAE